MSDDFMEDQPRYSKGKAKPVSLKPWQSVVKGEIKATSLRCWDGLTGCEEYKPKTAFRLHPLICDQCAEPLIFKFSVTRTDMELLAMVLQMDAGMYKTARYFKAKPEKIQALEAGREQYISQFVNMIKKMRNRFEIEAKTKSFQDWFYAQAEVDLPKSKTKSVKGFVTLAEAA